MSLERGTFEPYIAAQRQLPEFTLRAIVLGTVLGIIFGASSLYLVLKVGLTVSASIPVAVISLTVFRMLSKLGLRDASILENNIAQTAGSAGESIAFGVGVTMPAILILGFDLELTRIMLVAVLGGLLGILMMIPLRRALIVREHGKLKYPEGTACAEVLKAGASEESKAAAGPAAQEAARLAAASGLAANLGATTIFTGFGLGLAYNTLMKAFKGWKDIPERIFGEPFKAASVGIEITPELLGVGYIIGPRIALVMCGGGVLAYLVLIPLIKFFGDGLETALAPGGIPIRDMGPDQIRNDYILYIGAGAVAAGGIISLVKSLPTIWHGLRMGLASMSLERRGQGQTERTDRDLSMKFVGIGIMVLLAAIGFAPSLHMNLLGAVLIVIFGFLFVTVSSRLTGEIGSSSNPISGMTVATLLLTCLVFLMLGWTGSAYYVTALSIGGIVCIAASNGGTTSQDLKTGYLVGATPRLQQLAILIGAFISALCLGPILIALNNGYTNYVPVAEVAPGLTTNPDVLTGRARLPDSLAGSDPGVYRVWHKTNTEGGPAGKYLVDDTGVAVWLVDPGINGVHRTLPDGGTMPTFSAPKATLMSYIIKGILDRQLPWALVLAGVMIAVTLEMAGIPSLAFAVGVYLPLSASSPILVGGLVRWLVDRKHRQSQAGRGFDEAQLAAQSDRSPGVLLASGYIAGGAIAGIVIAFMTGALFKLSSGIERWSAAHNPFYSSEAWNAGWANGLALIPFLGIVVFLYLVGREKLLAGRQCAPGAKSE